MPPLSPEDGSAPVLFSAVVLDLKAAPGVAARSMAKEISAIDGILARKNDYGSWAKKYFRTNKGINLNYYTTNITAIEKTRDEKHAPFLYQAVGQPTEMFKLELLLGCSKGEDEGCFTIEIEDPADNEIEELELRAEDDATAERWIDAIKAMSDKAKADRLTIGTLSIEVTSGFLVGPSARVSPNVRLELQYPVDGEKPEEADVVSFTAFQPSKLDPDLLYENLDEAEDAVARIPRLTLKASLPVHQSSSKFCLRAIGSMKGDAKSIVAQTKKDESANSMIDLVACAFEEPLDEEGKEEKKLSDAPIALGRRVGSLFELQEDKAKWFATKFVDPIAADGEGRSAIDAGMHCDQLAPDGAKPKAGFKWYALLGEGDDSNVVRVILHAKIVFGEDPMTVVDGALERFEVPDVPAGDFEMKMMNETMERAQKVLKLGSACGKALDDFTHWVDPPVSAGLYGLMIVTAYFFPHCGLAIFPILMILPCCFVFSARLRDALGHDDVTKICDDRGCATMRVAVLEARGLAAADDNLTTEASSDPYVAVVTAPAEPPPEVEEARVPMVLGLTEVKSATLEPIWDTGVVDEMEKKRDDVAQATCFYAPDVVALIGGGSGAQDATKVSAESITNVGDKRLGSAVRAPIDFRFVWELEDGRTLKNSAWRFPLLQEVDQATNKPVPWAETSDAVDLEVFDSDMASADDFMGKVRLSISDLVASTPGRNGVHELEEWMALTPSDNAKDADIVREVLDAAEDGAAEPLGAVKVRVSLALPDPTQKIVPKELRIIKSLVDVTKDRYKLENSADTAGLDPIARAHAQYVEMQLMMKRAQNSLVKLTGNLERIAALFMWEHPLKTTAMILGLLASIVAAGVDRGGFAGPR